MALHGHIEVNGQAIGSWSARRTTPGPDPDGAAVYDCHVTMYADDPPRVETFHLTHVMDDGALALAARVLTRASRDRSRRDLRCECVEGPYFGAQRADQEPRCLRCQRPADPVSRPGDGANGGAR